MSRLAAVFGSARLTEGDTEYAEAHEVGRRLADAGWAVATGGYMGVMEAACRGAVEAGGHTVGVTVAGWEGRRPNRWVREERPGADLFDRLRILVGGSDAMVAVAGGVGTLAEVAVAWNLAQHAVRDGAPPRPLVLVGARWDALREVFDRHLVDLESDADLIRHARAPAEVPDALRGGHRAGWSEGSPRG